MLLCLLIFFIPIFLKLDKYINVCSKGNLCNISIYFFHYNGMNSNNNNKCTKTVKIIPLIWWVFYGVFWLCRYMFLPFHLDKNKKINKYNNNNNPEEKQRRSIKSQCFWYSVTMSIKKIYLMIILQSNFSSFNLLSTCWKN
jgi:hypothetical protein